MPYVNKPLSVTAGVTGAYEYRFSADEASVCLFFIFIILCANPMNRIKVISEPSELVPMLRSVDTAVKRDVLKEVTLEWRTAKEIEDKFGPEGKDAILFFEKMKLVESRWQSAGNNFPEKSYHTYYMSFHINAQWPVYEISDVLAVAMMGEKEFEETERKILEQIGKGGKFSGDVAETLGLSSTMLRSLVRRSVKMDYRGHRIELIQEK